MTSLGNIALSLKDRVMSLKSDYNVYFSLSSSFFGSKSFLHLVLLLTRLFSSSSDVGVKNLANSLTQEGPMRLRGSSWMSCNLSVYESLLLRGALAFSACTCFLDPLSLGRGYGGSGMFATGGAETGRGWFYGWLATCFSTAIRCCWSLKLSIWLLVTRWPWWSLVPASRLLKERSISSSSGDPDHDVLAELLVSGLEAFEDGCELLSDDVSDKELSVPLVLVLSVLELPDGELGKDTEDSLVVVSDTGCELAGWESLDEGCGSLRSECLVVTLVCLIGMSRSGSVTFSLKIPPVSGRGVTSGLPSKWYWHSAGHRVVPQTLSSLLVCLAGPSCLALSLKLRPEMYWFVWYFPYGYLLKGPSFGH